MARIERRAIAAYERELLGELRELALIEAGCTAVSADPSGLGSIALQLTGRLLVLRGVAASMCRLTGDTGPSARIVEVGRYDARWWVRLSNGHMSWTVLALRAYLSPNEGGLGVGELVA